MIDITRNSEIIFLNNLIRMFILLALILFKPEVLLSSVIVYSIAYSDKPSVVVMSPYFEIIKLLSLLYLIWYIKVLSNSKFIDNFKFYSVIFIKF